MRQFIKLFFIIFAICFLISCKDSVTDPNDTKDPNQGSAGLIPLKVGNNWKYNVYSNNLLAGELTLKVIYATTINNYQYFKFDDETPFGEYVTNKQDGFYMSDTIDNFELLYFKYPTQVGDMFGMYQFKVISIDTSITTIAGTFSTIYYQSKMQQGEGQEYNINVFIKPNLGIIKYGIETKQGTTTNSSSLQLSSYTLK